MSNTARRLNMMRNERFRTNLRQQTLPETSVEGRPVDALYFYPTTGQTKAADGNVQRKCIIQLPVEPSDLCTTKDGPSTSAVLDEEVPNSKSGSGTVGAVGMDTHVHTTEVSKAVDKIYKRIRERIMEAVPNVRNTKYPVLASITKQDVETVLQQYMGGYCQHFDDHFLDSVAAGILTNVGYGDFCCDKCGMVFKDGQQLEKHKKSRFPEPYICGHDGCIRQLCNVDSVVAHIKLSHGKNPSDATPYHDDNEVLPAVKKETSGNVKCTVKGCGRAFDTTRGLAIHRAKAHKTRRGRK